MLVMADLGLAYPPRSAVDETDHAARIALLAEDCSDLPIEHLRDAATEWRRTKPFLPRACELREDALARARIAMRGRMLPSQSTDTRRAKPYEPPLSAEEIANTPPHILKLGLALGEVTEEQIERVQSTTREG